MDEPRSTADLAALLAEAVSDCLTATTEGTDYTEAPEPSDEPGSPYVLRLTNELLAWFDRRGVEVRAASRPVGEEGLRVPFLLLNSLMSFALAGPSNEASRNRRDRVVAEAQEILRAAALAAANPSPEP